MKELIKNIFYIGVDDNEIDLFEGQYIVPNGISYNSYLIQDDKITVMDTVDSRKCDEWLSNLEEALTGKTPNYLVLLHMEPDHTGSLKAFLEKYPNTQVVSSAKLFNIIPQCRGLKHLADSSKSPFKIPLRDISFCYDVKLLFKNILSTTNRCFRYTEAGRNLLICGLISFVINNPNIEFKNVRPGNLSRIFVFDY